MCPLLEFSGTAVLQDIGGHCCNCIKRTPAAVLKNTLNSLHYFGQDQVASVQTVSFSYPPKCNFPVCNSIDP